MDDKLKIRNRLKTCVMLGSFSFGLMAFLLPIYSKQIGGNAVTIGGMFSVFSIVTFLLRPLIGKGIDRYGRKRFIVCSFLFYAASMFLFSVSTSITLLYISRLIQAVGASFMWVTAYSIAMDLSDTEKRGSSIGQVDGASAKGAVLGACIGFTILGSVPFLRGWSALFKGYAVLSLAAALIAFRFIPETKKEMQKEEHLPDEKKQFDKNFLKLLAVVFISSISVSMLSPLLMIYLQDKFTTEPSVIGLAYIPAALVYALLPSKLGGVSDKIGRIPPMIFGLLGSGIVSFGFTYCNSLAVLVLLWVLESVGTVMASPAEEAMVADLAQENFRGSAYGFYLFISSLGAAIGPLLGGWLYDFAGHAVPFYLNGAILLLNALLVLILFQSPFHREKVFGDGS